MVATAGEPAHDAAPLIDDDLVKAGHEADEIVRDPEKLQR